MMDPSKVTPEMMAAFRRHQQRLEQGGGGVPSMPMMGPPAGEGGEKDLSQYNPLKGGPTDLKILRGMTTECTIPEVAKFFNQMTAKLLTIQGDPAEILDAAGRGIATIMGADAYCRQNLKTRKVAHLKEDPALGELHESILSKTQELEQKINEVQELQQEVGHLAQERWTRVVKEYGLNPQERLYFIDEEEAVVEQLEIDCTECTGAPKAQNIRQEITELLMQQATTQKETEDDGQREGPGGDRPPEGNADEIGEAVLPEQEVPSVADSATPDGVDGDNSPGEAD